MKFIFAIALTATLLSQALAGHLLAVHLVATGSYIRIMNGILETLAPHHKITLYSVVHEEPPHPNVTLVKVRASQPKNFFFSGLFDYLCTHGTFWVSHKALLSLDGDYIEEIFADKNFKGLLTTKEKYDALLTFSTFSDYTFQVAHHLRLPLIEISAPVPFVHINDAVGNPSFLTTVHSFYDRVPGYTFLERVINYVTNFELHVRYHYIYLPNIEKVTNKYFPPDTPSIAEIHRNTSLLIINSHDALGHARPNMPNVVNIGAIHCRPPRPLPDDLEEFIQGSGEYGIIYFSFGSSIRSRVPESTKQAIIRVFSKLPQRIVWKWNEEISDLPSNVRIGKWFSQQDILGHNKTRLFITQSGLFSMEETAYHGVPVLAIPIAFDQHMNAIIARHLGYSEYISFCEFSEDRFYELIQRLLLDPKYRNNVKRTSRLMRDVPMTASENLIWWVDYVVRHRGNPIVHSMRDRSYGLKRMDLDVVTFLYVCITIALMLIIYLMYKAKQYFNTFRKDVSIKKKTE